MTRKFTLVAWALAVLGFTHDPLQAQGSLRVTCPLNQVTRTITNHLPEGWWTTPVINRVSDTRIEVVGGQRTLACVYGASGSIRREEPTGRTCTPVTRGFDCRPKASKPGTYSKPSTDTKPSTHPSPSTYSTGEVRLRQTHLVDLDHGQVGNTGADLWLEAETPYRLFLNPRNGAEISVGKGTNRGYEGCSRASFSSSRVALSAVPKGSYVCVRTNEKRISQFRVNGVSTGTPRTLTLGYTTWNR